ncbi:MAG: hypothetical protein KatS3mg011_0483 [Acidimicrobiia bacterium]|nr:MAG: hypothetical protein KatS3mg011_0483 [Acidimicrobiia bacterium]
MAVKFLSEDWAQAVETALNAHPGFDGQNPATKPAENGGVEVRVYVYNDMRNAQGVRTWIGLDRVRVLADY